MHSKSDNIEILINNDADKVAEEFFESILSRYQIELEILIRRSDFIFAQIDSLYYKCHKINLNHGRPYINSSIQINVKKQTINFADRDDEKCFQYTTRLALNQKELVKNSGRISKIKPFIDKYNWKDIDYPLVKDVKI